MIMKILGVGMIILFTLLVGWMFLVGIPQAGIELMQSCDGEFGINNWTPIVNVDEGYFSFRMHYDCKPKKSIKGESN